MTVAATVPRLLVSVRNITEAGAALAGGADILDIKDPSRGSLGRADAAVIHAVVAAQAAHSDVPISVALGEVAENLPQDVLSLPPSATFAKLGLAGMRSDRHWTTRWLSVRAAFERRAVSPVGWIAVIYADAERAQSPPAEEIICAAAATGCKGVLVDTFAKSGGGLLDFASPEMLGQWARAVRKQDMLFAAAGRLAPHDLLQLTAAAPDVIAVRSAVCADGDRRGAVDQDRVASLKGMIRHAFSVPQALSAIR